MKTLTSLLTKTTLAICAFIISFVFATAVPVPAKFFVNTFNADVGDTVEFELKIEGTASVPVYTVIANLEYDKSLLKFNSATAQAGWIPVAPDDVTDTKNGVIKRTAGYPSGLKQLASVYKYSFTALAPGDAKVSILGSSAYDAENNDSGLQNKSITVKIGGVKEEVVQEPKTTSIAETKTDVKIEKKPQQITLEFVGMNGLDASKEYSFLIKHNLKVQQETVGSSSLAIVDTNGREVWSTTKDFSINDSSEMLITVPANTIIPGNYILDINTKYDNQKNDTKLSKELGVVGSTEKIITQEVPKAYIPWYLYVVGLVMFLWYLLTLTYYRSKKFRKFLKNF